jgi:hypothetical protein
MSSATQTSARMIKAKRPGILAFIWMAPPATAVSSIAEFQQLRYRQGRCGRASAAPAFIHGSPAEAHHKLSVAQPYSRPSPRSLPSQSRSWSGPTASLRGRAGRLLENQPNDDCERGDCAEHERQCAVCHDHGPLMVLCRTGSSELL